MSNFIIAKLMLAAIIAELDFQLNKKLAFKRGMNMLEELIIQHEIEEARSAL